MLDAIKALFRSSMSADQVADDEQVPDIRLAACALLLELAYADNEFTEDESDHLISAIRRQYGVEGSEAEELIVAAHAELESSVDLFQFTKLIRDNYSLGQKMVLAEIMWGLVYADGEVSADEEYLMRKVCSLLKLEPGYLADARKRVEGS